MVMNYTTPVYRSCGPLTVEINRWPMWTTLINVRLGRLLVSFGWTWAPRTVNGYRCPSFIGWLRSFQWHRLRRTLVY